MVTNDKFVVRSPTASTPSLLFWLCLGGPLLLLLFARVLDKDHATTTSLLTGGLSLFLLQRLKSKEAREATVTIYPLGVQLTGKNATPVFLPHEAILDVIVLEMVHSYKVTSAVVFRVVRDGATATVNISKLLQQDRIVLIPAFPGMAMTYQECQTMWHAISTSLAKL